MLSDQELAALLEAADEARSFHGRGVGQARQQLYDLAPALAQELIKLREVLRLWDDHLPGCSGSPRCECGYAEARALLEVQDAK